MTALRTNTDPSADARTRCPEDGPESAETARTYFPRGLSQPVEGYRFSLDALLLACFATAPGRGRVLDLGCGCGVIGLGLLLRCGHERLRLTGLDRDPAMVAHARDNARKLGLAEASHFSVHDVGQPDTSLAQQFDLVLANPPFRDSTGGRVSREGKKDARFDSTASTQDFVHFGSRALKTRGRLALVHLPERLGDIMTACERNALVPKRLRFVHGKADREARILLLEAVRGGRGGPVVEPPLMLYDRGQGETAMTQDALEFCPWLRCNA